jgi:urease subunit gamma/beta
MAAMRLTAWEEERLLIFTAAELARRHRAAGLRLNAPEVIALMSDAMLDAARAGRSYREVEAAGIDAVGLGEVLDGVRELVDEVRLEVLVGDGTRLVVLVDPLGRGRPASVDGPGAIRAGAARWDADGAGRERRSIVVRNDSRRAVRVSSHHPFDRVNQRLVFDRAATRGFRLDLPAGTSERWEPGETREVAIVRYGGSGGDGAIADGAPPPKGRR